MEKLQDKHLLNISGRLSSKSDIRRLCCELNVPDYKVDALLKNSPGDIEEGVYTLLKEWLKRQRGRKEACITLFRALTADNVGLSMIAHEVLQQEPPDVEHLNKELPKSQRKLKSGEKKRKLKDDDIVRITSSLSPSSFQKLMSKLPMEASAVSTFLSQKIKPKKVKKVAAEILKQWLNNQESREDANSIMGEALVQADLKLVAKEVLDYSASQAEAPQERKAQKRRKRRQAENGTAEDPPNNNTGAKRRKQNQDQ